MKDTNIWVGSERLKFQEGKVKSELLEIKGESYYKICNYDLMRPFFMSLASDSDIWMFVSSQGGLTAGRGNSDRSIFPYYTDDQITSLSEYTGSYSTFLIDLKYKKHLWTPFSNKFNGLYKTDRNLYKNALGNKLIFEEINHDLSLVFTYTWLNSGKYGIIKKAEIVNNSVDECRISSLDGIINILPPGILQGVQQTKSNLAGAYKKSELRASGIGVFSLSSNIIDRSEPSEALLATTVISSHIEDARHLLSTKQINSFIHGQELIEETGIRAESGAFLINRNLELPGRGSESWYFAIDTNQNSADIVELERLIYDELKISSILEKDIANSTQKLQQLVSAADGFQLTADQVGNMRHTSNSLFNSMRGGVFTENYTISKKDFITFVLDKSRESGKVVDELLAGVQDNLSITQLRDHMLASDNVDLVRYSYEYLPITFSRRHGDPSRPWNKFNIDVLKEDGSWKKWYEGNWRDIFQNWEALCYSFPDYIENVISIFLNVSTIDGYNPYRITSKGFEWEVTDPDDPWSFIGYWGDHQIIYLLRLLELSDKFHPGKLAEFMDNSMFTFADIPYRIRSYEDIVKNPHDTVAYSLDAERKIDNRVKRIGEDGKLVWCEENLLYATLTEKLLITLLTKLSNFVPEGGIWMNTQRPEWNDANNALVGHGLSMVTVYHIHRYLNFLIAVYENAGHEEFSLSPELEHFFQSIYLVFKEQSHLLSAQISNSDRKRITDQLGLAGQTYRQRVYEINAAESINISKEDLLHFFTVSNQFIKHAIKANLREDHLYHSYNLIELNHNAFGIKNLYMMLEGQVAILSSGYLQPEASLKLVSSLQQSALYREDQHSYLLYPDKELPTFVKKAKIDKLQMQNSALFQKLLQHNEASIIYQDLNNEAYFSSSLCNADELKRAMEQLDRSVYGTLIDREKQDILDVYEEVFHHHEFTGRSGTFFGYEGLGSIYWHMNSKLLLAIQECICRFAAGNTEEKLIRELKEFYYQVKIGLGTGKNPADYGAFPTDPYSHTPANKGAQQPGMTGQVKEDLISRLGELGVVIIDGCIEFSSIFLDQDEFLSKPDKFVHWSFDGEQKSISVGKDCLTFTFCQTPIIYTNTGEAFIEVSYQDKSEERFTGHRLAEDLSKQVFERTGIIDKIIVSF